MFCLAIVLAVAVSVAISAPVLESFYNVLLLQSLTFSKIVLLSLLWYVWEASAANDALAGHT